MAGVIAKRLRLTTSRKPSYRRGGVKIGTVSAPTYLEQGDVSLEQALEIVRDPNIALAFEDEEGGVQPLTADERSEIEAGIVVALAQAADADDAAGGDDAGTTEPTAQPNPPASEPAAAPKPASTGGGKAKGTPA